MKNTPWRWTGLAALLLQPLLAHAEGSDHEMARTRCKSPLGSFEVVIRSPSGQPVEDDMTVWIEREGKPPLRVDFGGQTAWFELAADKTKRPSACTGTVAFLTQPGQMVVLLGTDDRPAAQALSAFVYDVAAHAVSSAAFKIAPFLPPLEIVPGREGPLFHSTFPLEEPAHCQGPCPPVDGVPVTRVDELPLTPWYELRVEKGRLVPRLSLSETRQREGLSPFFKDDRTFGEATRLAPPTNTSRVYRYKLALRADGSKCVYLVRAGAPPEEKWRCAPASRK